jgi:hypothetical protein
MLEVPCDAGVLAERVEHFRRQIGHIGETNAGFPHRLERLDRIGPRFQLQKGIHQRRAHVRIQVCLGCLEGECRSVVENLPEVDIDSVQRPLPAVFEDARAPRIRQLRALARKRFFDHGIDRERIEDRECIESDRFDGPHCRLGERADANGLKRCSRGAQVFLNAINGSRLGGAHEARLELLPMGAVVDPFTRCGHPLAGRNSRGMADDRDQIAVTACLDPQNAEATVGIVKGDAFDKAGEHFLPCGFLLEGHRHFKSDCSSNWRQRIALERIGQGIRAPD